MTKSTIRPRMPWQGWLFLGGVALIGTTIVLAELGLLFWLLPSLR